MTNDLRDRFRAFARSHFGCGIRNPRKPSEVCDLDYGHNEKHSWEPRIRVLSPEQQARRHEIARGIAMWTRPVIQDGRLIYHVRVYGRHSPGDVVTVVARSGNETRVMLGERIKGQVYAVAKTEADGTA